MSVLLRRLSLTLSSLYTSDALNRTELCKKKIKCEHVTDIISKHGI